MSETHSDGSEKAYEMAAWLRHLHRTHGESLTPRRRFRILRDGALVCVCFDQSEAAAKLRELAASDPAPCWVMMEVGE